MDFGGFFTGIFFTGLGGFFIGIYYFLYRIDIDKFRKSYVSYWWLIIGIPIALFGLIIIWQAIFPTRYYCSDCGQYLGFSSKHCPRCGCNIYTTEYKGVGRTNRRGPYNL